MQVTETVNESLKREYKIVLPAADIAERVSARLEELQGQVRLPGFRPGKVPASMLRKRFGKSALGEVLEAAVQDSFRRLIDEKGLRPALQPQIDFPSDVEEGQDVAFTLAVEVLPEIADPDFAALTLERESVAVEDKALDEAVEELRGRMKTFEATAEGHAAEMGDSVLIDFVGRLDGEAFEGGSSEDFRLELGSATFIPGFEEQLVGVSAGETRTVTVPFPEDYPVDHLKGREAAFEVKVHAIERPVLPEVDEALAKKLGLETVEQVRDEIRKNIQNDYDEACQARLKRRLLDVLAEQSTFEVPEGLLEAEFKSIWDQVSHALEHGHLDEEDKGKSEEQLRTDYRAIALRRLRLGLLLAEVGQRHKVTVAPEDLNKALMREMRRFPGQEAAVINYYRQSKEAMERLRAPVFEDKVCAFILEQASVTEKAISAEELKAALENDRDAA
ncbi:trigger factor [Pararhodospirillum photometricum]|nr:trigger factor [Pararhodospirillum photometricum]